jgi:curli production assembly/transport component CsgG
MLFIIKIIRSTMNKMSRNSILPASKVDRAGSLAVAVACILLAGCSGIPPANVKSNAKLTPSSEVTRALALLPEPKAKVGVAVYAFRDETGQYKGSPDSAYSTMVTQGATSMLVKALRDSGWYIPVEREGLQNLLTERRIVRAIETPGDKGKPLVNLPNLMPASLLVEGGVLGYETNVRTGGKGANYLGIGADSQYRVDQVTVGLRSVDVRNGQVLNAVSVTKTIYSYQFSASIYRFIAYQKLLQGEVGYTTNEPAQLAVREAIEAAVIHLTVQGIRDRVLELKHEGDWNSPVIQGYLAESVNNQGIQDEVQGDEVLPMRPMNMSRKAQKVQPLLPAQPGRDAGNVASVGEATDGGGKPADRPSDGSAARAEGRADEGQGPAEGASAAVQPNTGAEAKGALAKPAASDDIFGSYWRGQARK